MTYPNQKQIYKQMNKLGLWKSYSNVQHKQKRLQKAAIVSFEVEFSFRNVHKRSKRHSKMEYECIYVCMNMGYLARLALFSSKQLKIEGLCEL